MRRLLFTALLALGACASSRPSLKLRSDVKPRAAAEEIVKIVAAGAANDSFVMVSPFSEDHYVVGATWHEVGRRDQAILVASIFVTVDGDDISVRDQKRICSGAETTCRLPAAGPVSAAEIEAQLSELPPARDPQVFDEKKLAARIEAAVGQHPATH